MALIGIRTLELFAANQPGRGVGTIVGREYPYLEAEDIAEALSYGAWRAEEVEVPLRHP